MIYIGVDPGGESNGTTGIVEASSTATSLELLMFDNLNKWEVRPYLEGVQKSEAYKNQVIHFVIEDYAYHQGVPNQSSTPAKIAGMFAGFAIGLANGTHRVRYYYRQPVQRTWVTDEMLDALGLGSVCGGNHHDAKEAARHLVSYLVDSGNLYAQKKLEDL